MLCVCGSLFHFIIYHYWRWRTMDSCDTLQLCNVWVDQRNWVGMKGSLPEHIRVTPVDTHFYCMLAFSFSVDSLNYNFLKQTTNVHQLNSYCARACSKSGKYAWIHFDLYNFEVGHMAWSHFAVRTHTHTHSIDRFLNYYLLFSSSLSSLLLLRSVINIR